jgi:adenylylsulfate kinase
MKTMESHLRSFIKAISWRFFATMTTMVITFLITHQLTFALYVGFFEFFSKIFLFYLHERIWGYIPIGVINPIVFQKWKKELS